ncbi:hypothetical protein [uncultured Winogradskyella sp.]|uniref:hypothetical protein n=1 Tax=uncultured Winogradskyella sp. TaxID=395353 RepID=UPI002610568D|nr:hypothetical protein [uncultured Winogradskyella sp.]
MNYLKNTFVFALLLSFITTSCSSDDSSSNPSQQTTDKIELSLTTSKSAYQNANVGSWVKITGPEYNLLEITLDNVSKSGTTDEQYSFNSNIIPVGSGDDGITMANNNGATIPNNGYVFAFRYNVTEDNVDSAKVKISSTNPQDEYSNLGSTLPMHDSGENYFVLKRNNTPTTNSGFLAIFCPKKIGYKELASTNTIYYFSQSDASTLGTTGATDTAVILYQGLSTTEKQWD